MATFDKVTGHMIEIVEAQGETKVEEEGRDGSAELELQQA
ncbi:unnamed protein product [Ectocarpus sp. 12 AP-2014]